MVHKVVTDDPPADGYTAAGDGEWVVIVHDCVLPTLQQIKAAQATFGTTWKCNCGSVWKLDMSKQAKTNASVVLGTRLLSDYSAGDAGVKHPEITDLRWIRIRTSGVEEN